LHLWNTPASRPLVPIPGELDAESAGEIPGPQKLGTGGTLNLVGNGHRDRGHPPRKKRKDGAPSLWEFMGGPPAEIRTTEYAQSPHCPIPL